MVVLTIVTENSGETIYFEDPIPKVHFMKLTSCSLFNSWDTLKNEGSASLGDKDKDEALSISRLLPGHYNLESLAKEIDGLFVKYNYDLKTEINQPVGQLVIKIFGSKPIELDRDLANLLGIGRKLKLITFVKRLTSPTTYFIHCDLIDKEQNVFNGNGNGNGMEMQKNRQLKETLRSNFAQKQTNSRQPDLEKIKNQIRQEFRKKLAESSTNVN